MGPVRGDWPNYGKLSVKRHHRHTHIFDENDLSRLKGKLARMISHPSGDDEKLLFGDIRSG